MRFYTLIYVGEDEELAPNAPARDFESQIGLYLGCARLLHQSLAAFGLELTVLTNNRSYLEEFEAASALSVEQVGFTLVVPLGIPHRSTHFRFELFSYLAETSDPYAALVDCDLVCVNPLPPGFVTLAKEQIGLYYDITDQITPAVGAEMIVRNKELVSGRPSFGLWAGGEFLAGPPSFFRLLAGEVAGLAERYFEHLSELYRHGDELVTSAAIEKLILDPRIPVVDAGQLGIVGRYWGCPTMHVQKPLAAYRSYTVLHLPYDKAFLSGLQSEELERDAFFERYSQHLSPGERRVPRRIIWSRKAVSFARELTG